MLVMARGCKRDGIVMEVSACRYGIVRGYLFRPVEKSRLVGDL